MTVLSAHDVAAELRRRRPGLPIKKMHKLLYYCQGHHLATFGTPLFRETISAWDMGPVVGELWYAEGKGDEPISFEGPDEAGLNTVGYVLNRYGSLTGTDLEHLTHSETPWQRANAGRRPGTSARIAPEWIQDYFATVDQDEADRDAPLLDSQAVNEWLEGAEARLGEVVRPDSLDELRARLSVDA